MAHTLILLRHAKSDWAVPASDHDRPLAARGQRQAPEAGRWLAAHHPAIDLALTSPANRARATWELASAELTTMPRTETEDLLYAFSAAGPLGVVQGIDESLQTVLLVGHNPALEDLVEELTGEWVTMPTSALALIELPGDWAEAGDESARLVAAGRPPAVPG